jgi:hypothetical protein
MTDFDNFDDDLAVALQRRVPQVEAASIGTASAHDAVLARAHGIRRRRAGIAGAATLAAVIAGGVVLLNGDADDTLAPATAPSTATAPDTAAPTSTSEAPTSTVPRPSTTGDSVATVVTVPVPPISATVSTGAETVPPTTAQPSPTSPSTSSTVATQPPAPSTETYDSSGGSITVTWNGSALSLDAVNPTDGHTAEIEDETATRIRVRFRGPAESRIEVRVENGQVTERID